MVSDPERPYSHWLQLVLTIFVLWSLHELHLAIIFTNPVYFFGLEIFLQLVVGDRHLFNFEVAW